MANVHDVGMSSMSSTRSRRFSLSPHTISDGAVGRTVRELNARVIGASAGDFGTRAQHGTAEQGYRSRNRQRSPHRQSDRYARETSVRANPAGEQEALDWLQALEGVYDRLDALERHNNLHAATIAKLNEDGGYTSKKLKIVENDITAYKNFLSSTHTNMESVLKNKFDGLNNQINVIQSTLDSITSIIPPAIETIDAKIKEVEVAFAQSQTIYTGTPVPPGLPVGAQAPAAAPAPMRAEIGTPVEPADPQSPFAGNAAPAGAPVAHGPPQPRDEGLFDPWAAEAARLRAALPAAQAAPAAPDARYMAPELVPDHAKAEFRAQAPPPPPRPEPQVQPEMPKYPPMPNAFAGNFEQSPFETLKPGYVTPDRVAGGAGHSGPGKSAWSDNKPCMFEISRKENKLLAQWTRNAADFQLWRDRIVDHCCRSTMHWRHLLEYCAKATSAIQPEWLRSNNVAGINAWDLSTMLESFMVDWFPKSMYRRRVPLAGGTMGNGLEMWRLLHVENKGGGDAIEFGGVRRLQEFPRCNEVKHLNEHIDDWLDVLSQFGSELEHCPKLLKSMIFAIIPKNYEDELLTKPEFCKDYHSIIKWCRMKTQILRTRELAELSRKPHHAKALRGKKVEEEEDPAEEEEQPPAPPQKPVDEVPPWAQALVAAVGRANPTKKPTRAEPKRKPRPRAVIPPGFTFEGCWHCKGKDHTRSGGRDGKGAKCPGFAKLMKDANPGITERRKMKLPTGYMGAYEKALIAAGGKPRRVNALDGALSDEDYDSEESDFNVPTYMGGVAAALVDDGDDSSDDDDFTMCGSYGRGICNRGRVNMLRSAAPNSDEPTPPPPAAWTPVTGVSEDQLFREHKLMETAKNEKAWPDLVAALGHRSSVEHPNRYRAIADEETSLDDDTLSSLNGWAKVHYKKLKKKKSETTASVRPAAVPTSSPVAKPDVYEKFTIKTEAELDNFLQTHPQIAALPDDQDKVRRILRSKPVELECDANEVLCLVDSGSTINAANVEKHFPSYKQFVRETRKSKSGDFARTACGKKLFNRGRCDIRGSADGEEFPVAFKDMKVEMPILSVRKIVKKNNRVCFQDGGGYIRNQTSGRRIRFYEFEGVYFLKLRTDQPSSDTGQVDFHRPGTP